MSWVLAALAVALILMIFVDGFETMLLPRRVTRALRLTRLFYRTAWWPWRELAKRLPPKRIRPTFLSVFGPFSLFALFAVWVAGLMFGFALFQWALSLPLNPVGQPADLGTYFYLSGVTFITLGYGDLTPASSLGRVVAVVESATGFGFLAVIIGYLPVLYQAFSRREVTISLLDARASSPPTAAELLRRDRPWMDPSRLDALLTQWESWVAEVLESHLSFPILSYYRSQHDNQSWLSAMTAILDTCSLIIVGVVEMNPQQARLTFAMARHAAVDLSLVFRRPPRAPPQDRLPPETLQKLRALLEAEGLLANPQPDAPARLAELRSMYEPFVQALADYFLFEVPPFLCDKPTIDNWRTSAWTRRAARLETLGSEPIDEHFD
jgi:ion channel